MVITSPNCGYIPEWPVESSVVQTYANGRWGIHEYSLVPQDLCRGMWHVACIPASPSPPHLPPILWEPLSRELNWHEDLTIGINGLGFVNLETRRALAESAKLGIRAFEDLTMPEHVREYGIFLCMMLRQLLSHMRNLPGVANVSIAVAARIQRITLELAGLITYMEVVMPHLESSQDYSTKILPVAGSFVRNATDAQSCHRVGIPLWFLQLLTRKILV